MDPSPGREPGPGGGGELDVAALGSLRSRLVGSRVHHLEVTASTMDEARALAEAGAAEGTVVVAERQTLGRGRFGRRWVSDAGRDLALSVVLRPGADRLRMVNMAVTMAVQDTAAEVTGRPAAVKWPNDVVMSGRKVCGILVETLASRRGGLEFAVVGVGLNVNLRPSDHPEIGTTATSLAEQAGRAMDRTCVLVSLLGRIDDLYAMVRAGTDLAPLWAPRIETIGRMVSVRWRDRSVSGRARGVDGEGNLLVETGGGLETVVAGEVTLAAHDPAGRASGGEGADELPDDVDDDQCDDRG